MSSQLPRIQTTYDSSNSETESQQIPASESANTQTQSEADNSLQLPNSPNISNSQSRGRDGAASPSSPIGTRITPVRSNSTSRFHEHISSGENSGDEGEREKEGLEETGQPSNAEGSPTSSPTRRKSIGLGGLGRALSSKSRKGSGSGAGRITKPAASRTTTADTNFTAVTALKSPALFQDQDGEQVQLARAAEESLNLNGGVGKSKAEEEKIGRSSDSSWERVEAPTAEQYAEKQSSLSKKKGRSSSKKVKSSAQNDGSNPNLKSSKRDPLLEPRRNIRPRALEKEIGKAIGGPNLRSGVVVETSSSLRDWIPSPVGLNSLQGAYLLIAHCIGAAIISGAINFGIGVATYINQPAVHIWIFNPITLAGDMGLTVILQQMITMLITSSMVHSDIANGPIVAPLRKPWPPLLHLPSTPSPTGNFFGFKTSSEVSQLDLSPLPMGKSTDASLIKQWFLFVIRSIFTGSEKNNILAPGLPGKVRFQRILWTAFQGLCLSVFTFWWYWPISIAIVAPLYEHREEVLVNSYIAPVIKLIFGGVLSLLTNPIMALMAMGAEFNVRRAYPELECWREFGGDEDTTEWRKEMGVDAGKDQVNQEA